MKASINGTVVAEATDADLVVIEGNYYFPPSALLTGAVSDSTTPYNCPWKGDAQYHHVTVDGTVYQDAAWSYPTPYSASLDIVGSDYSGFVAFDKAQTTIA